MEIITLNKDNIADEHICCSFSDKKCKEGYEMKKQWLSSQFENGYVFKKYDVRHKVFIEYVPAEHSWSAINADGYMLINCFWVAGSYKGKGFGKNLLNECIKDSKDKKGIVVITSKKKTPFLSDKKFMLKNGFEVCDSASPYFELLVRKNNPKFESPTFTKEAKENICDNKNGLTIYYTNQCPFNEYYVNVELQEIADSYNIPLKIIKINSKEQAKKLPSAFGLYSLFYNGKFLTHEIMSKKRFDKIWNNL